jgi:hypothetical protein
MKYAAMVGGRLAGKNLRKLGEKPVSMHIICHKSYMKSYGIGSLSSQSEAST